MKIKSVKEIEIEDTQININIDLKKQKATITLSYTCPRCAGHGCHFTNNCDGSVYVNIDPTKIDDCLDKITASKLRSIVESLHASLNETN